MSGDYPGACTYRHAGGEACSLGSGHAGDHAWGPEQTWRRVMGTPHPPAAPDSDPPPVSPAGAAATSPLLEAVGKAIRSWAIANPNEARLVAGLAIGVFVGACLPRRADGE